MFMPVSSYVVSNVTVSSQYSVCVSSSMLAWVFLRLDFFLLPSLPPFLRPLGSFLGFINSVLFFQSPCRAALYSSTPPSSSVNSGAPAVVAVAAFPLPAVMLRGPPGPLIVLARLLPATESALIVEEAGVARPRAPAKPKPLAALLWKGSSSSSLLERSLLRRSFLYSSMIRRKSKMNFLMMAVCEHTQENQYQVLEKQRLLLTGGQKRQQTEIRVML